MISHVDEKIDLLLGDNLLGVFTEFTIGAEYAELREGFQYATLFKDWIDGVYS
jgi:hypothetical protein